tara:strand:- start:6317 stop:6571 length:255 start_codon:yes stop_codon:yes gene_type:complete
MSIEINDAANVLAAAEKQGATLTVSKGKVTAPANQYGISYWSSVDQLLAAKAGSSVMFVKSSEDEQGNYTLKVDDSANFGALPM